MSSWQTKQSVIASPEGAWRSPNLRDCFGAAPLAMTEQLLPNQTKWPPRPRTKAALPWYHPASGPRQKMESWRVEELDPTFQRSNSPTSPFGPALDPQ